MIYTLCRKNMKRKILTAALLSVCLLASCARQSESPAPQDIPGAPAQASRGDNSGDTAVPEITITMSCDKTDYTKGEQIKVSVTVSNVSSRTLIVPNGSLKSAAIPRCIRVSVKTENNDTYLPLLFPEAFIPPARDHFRSLRTRRAMTINFVIEPGMWVRSPNGARLAKVSGQYRVQCRFANSDRTYWDPDASGSTAKPDNMWISESDLVETRITVE